MNIIVRPRTRDDDPRLLEIYLSHERVFTMTLEGFRHFIDERVRPEGVVPEIMVAERDGVIVGDWFVERNADVHEQGVYYGSIEVDTAYCGQGMGGELWKRMEESLRSHRARKIYASVTEDHPYAADFAVHRGFEATGRAERISRLDVPTANLSGYEGIEDRMASLGVSMITAHEIDADDEPFMRKLHARMEEAIADIPSSEEHKARPFEVWRANWLKYPALIPGAYFVAVKNGAPVGLANLNRASEERVFNGFTGVARSARGLGIARALKLKTIEWSKANGIKSIDTGNDMSNERMLSINIPLGYQALPARFEYMRLME